MVDIPYQIALVFAGFVYIVTPGPVFLSILSFVPEKGRIEGVKFTFGAIFGGSMWLAFTCVSLVESDRLPRALFVVLGLVCAFYLFFLAAKMFLKSAKNKNSVVFKRPIYDGLVMSVLNPKAYPVMTSVVGGIMLQYEGLLQWSNFGEIFVLVFVGFVLGYVFMVMVSSFKVIKIVYAKHIRVVSMLFGGIFAYFGAILIMGVFS
jgi:threonine/homoserine/homoserine lactone efflux protein